MDACSEVAKAEWGGLREVEAVVRGWLWRRCRHDSDVDDVVQDTLLRAARYRGRLEHSERLAGWALSIAANTLRDRKRRERRCASADGGELDLDQLAGAGRACESPAGSSALRIGGVWVTTEEALEELREALCGLRPSDRELLLEFYGGASMRELAGRLGVGTTAIKCRLYRARRGLTRVLEQRLRRSTRGAGAVA